MVKNNKSEFQIIPGKKICTENLVKFFSKLALEVCKEKVSNGRENYYSNYMFGLVTYKEAPRAI